MTMNRPEGISESAWEAAADPAKRILAGEDFTTIEAFERVLFAAQCTISRAIQSSVEAERERAAKICETVGKRLEGREFSGTVLEVAVREAVNEATHNACVILAKHIRKGA